MEASSASMLLKKLIKLPDSTSFRYLLSLPPSYSEDLTKRWPLILFLHGSGESGADLERVKIHGIPRLVQVYDDWKKGTASTDDITMEGSKITVIPEKDSSVKQKKPINLECAKIVAENYITLSPQVDPKLSGYDWKPKPLGLLLDQIEQDYRVDKERIYVTGISMGGFGTFTLAASFPKRFAAILPICGGMDVEQAKLIKDIPMWIFHGKKDQIVHMKNSENVVKALEKLGKKVPFTVYDDADHDSWTETYNNREIYNWFSLYKNGNLEKGSNI